MGRSRRPLRLTLTLLLAGGALATSWTTASGYSIRKSAIGEIVNRSSEARRLRLFFSPNYFFLSGDAPTTNPNSAVAPKQVTLSGASFSSGIGYALSEAWLFSAGLRQAFSSEDEFATLFTAIDTELVYALSGQMHQSIDTYEIDDHRLLRTHSAMPSGWRASAFLTQYFLNARTTTLPFAGIGFGLGYEFTLFESLTNSIMFKIGRVSNGEARLYPIQWHMNFDVVI